MKKRNMLKRNSGFIVGCVVAAGASFITADAVMSDRSILHISQTDEISGETETAELTEETTETRTYETDPFTVTSSGKIIKGVETEISETETEENEETEEISGDGETVSRTDSDGNESLQDGIDSDENSGSAGGDSGTYDSGSDSAGTGGSGYTDSSGSGSSDTGNSGSGAGSSGSSSSDGSGSGSSGSNSSDAGSTGTSGSGSSGGSGGSGQQIEIIDPGNGEYHYNDNSGSNSQGGSSGSGNSGAWTPADVIIQGISSRYIDESELYNYSEGQLRLIRNEIFALHGRIFRSQDLADYFSQKSWYVPMYDPDEFDANMFYYLNDYEEANLKVILNYEAALAGN